MKYIRGSGEVIQCFVLVMKYTFGSCAPSYIFHNQHKAWNNLYMSDLGHAPSCFLYFVFASRNGSGETFLNVTAISTKVSKAGS